MQENLAAQYLAKTRKLQCCLEEAEERAETAESALNKVRSRSRAGVSTGGVGRTTSREVSRPLSPLHHRYYSLNSLSPNSTRYLDSNSRLSSYYWLELLYAIPLCFLEVLFSFSCGKSFVIIIRGSSCREILSALPVRASSFPNSARDSDHHSRLLCYYWPDRLFVIPLCLLDVFFSVSCATSFVILSDFISGSSCRDILSVLPVSVLRQFQLN